MYSKVLANKLVDRNTIPNCRLSLHLFNHKKEKKKKVQCKEGANVKQNAETDITQKPHPMDAMAQWPTPYEKDRGRRDREFNAGPAIAIVKHVGLN